MLKQGELVELAITDLNSDGDGVGRVDGCVVFVPNSVTGDRLLVRMVRVKRTYGYGQINQIITPSPHRIRSRCIVADKCGGCQWQHIDYQYQCSTKRHLVIQALERLGHFANPPVADILGEKSWELGYRNKASYPLGVSASGMVQAGYYRPHSHRLVNINQCPIQDVRLNPLLAEIKRDIQDKGWSIYDEKQHRGQLRHLSLRIGRRTGEILLTLVSTEKALPAIAEMAEIWLKRYPHLVGVTLNHNQRKTNVIFGEETLLIAGRGYLREIFGELEFYLRPETFFQVNTELAESVLAVIEEQLSLKGDEIVVDAYCGIGTFTLTLAQKVKQIVGIEVQAAAVRQAQENAQINRIDNATFYSGAVEELLAELAINPDVIILDPPRQGCDRRVLEQIVALKAPQLVYISCQPGTLARDLQWLCDHSSYQLTLVQPADFFPQTAHVESIAFLKL